LKRGEGPKEQKTCYILNGVYYARSWGGGGWLGEDLRYSMVPNVSQTRKNAVPGAWGGGGIKEKWGGYNDRLTGRKGTKTGERKKKGRKEEGEKSGVGRGGG